MSKELLKKRLLKKTKPELIAYYKRKLGRLERRIDYLEGKRFYLGIKKDILKNSSEIDQVTLKEKDRIIKIIKEVMDEGSYYRKELLKQLKGGEDG